MRAFNHVAGGLAFTGIFASFSDINVFSQPSLIVGTVVFSQLPDIDHTRSTIGKTVWPLARFISQRFGHRTITHSLPFFVGILIIIKILEKLFSVPPEWFTLAAYSVGSHLIFDACTKQGVPLLYPFSKRPFVIPANPDMRLSASDYRTEAVIFILFCATLSFCRPLFANGFWTQYNRAFMTWEHIEREFTRSPNAIEVTYTDKDGHTQTGIFLKPQGAKLVVLDRNRNFQLFAPEDTKPKDFHRTRWKIKEHNQQLFNVTADSLNRWLSFPVISAQIQSPSDFYFFDGAVMKAGTTATLTNQRGTVINTTTTDRETVNTKIKLLQIEHEIEQNNYLQKRALWAAVLARLQSLRDELPHAGNFRKGEIITELAALEKRIQENPEPVAPDLSRYPLQIKLLKLSLKPQTLNANVSYLTIE